MSVTSITARTYGAQYELDASKRVNSSSCAHEGPSSPSCERSFHSLDSRAPLAVPVSPRSSSSESSGASPPQAYHRAAPLAPMASVSALLARRASCWQPRDAAEGSSTDVDTYATVTSSRSHSHSVSASASASRRADSTPTLRTIFSQELDGRRDDSLDPAQMSALADIARCASLAEVGVDVAIAHTRHLLKARFFVALTRAAPVRTTWGVGTSLSALRAFEKRMRRVVRAHLRSPHATASRWTQPKPCGVCLALKGKLSDWKPVPRLSVISGKHKLAAKAERVQLFFTELFTLLAGYAPWAHQCPALRELLEMTECLARIRYPADHAVVSAIAEFRPVSLSLSTASECMICLDQLASRANSSRFPVELDKREKPVAVMQSRSAVQLPCGHEFHDTCMCQWLNARVDCPVCRALIVATGRGISKSEPAIALC